MHNLHKIINEKLEYASMGLSEWHRIDSGYDLQQNDYVVLFCDDDIEVNESGMLYLDTFLDRVEGNKVVVLTNNKFVADNIKDYSKKIISVEECNDEQVTCLLSLYSLFHFDHRFRVVSLEKPHGRKAKSLIGVKGTTVEQLVAIGVYGIIPFRSLNER